MTAHRFVRFYLCLACVLCVLAISGCGTRASEAEVAMPTEFEREGATVIVPEHSTLRPRLRFVTAGDEQVRQALSLPAAIEADPRRYARVYPPIGGRLVQLHVQLGDQVEQGQVVASLHSAEFAQAQGDYVKARSALQIAAKNLERQRDLFAHKIAAERDVEEAQNDHEAAQSDLQSAAARLKIFGVNPERDPLGRALPVLAPVSGRIVELEAALGEFRNDSNAPLMTIADLSTVWLTASMQEKDLRFVKLGQDVRARLLAYPNETFSGTIVAIADVLDPATRTVKVRVIVPNDQGRLKPGMFAQVELMDFPKTLVTVPNTAIVQTRDMAVIYQRVTANEAGPWRLEPRQVTLGPQLGERTVVLAGLDSGASILASEGVLLQR